VLHRYCYEEGGDQALPDRFRTVRSKGRQLTLFFKTDASVTRVYFSFPEIPYSRKIIPNFLGPFNSKLPENSKFHIQIPGNSFQISTVKLIQIPGNAFQIPREFSMFQRGFSLDYEFVDESADGGGCGFHTHALSGVVHSPTRNNTANGDYPPNASCLWDIQVPQGYHIHLVFQAFDIAPSRGCANDRCAREINKVK
jgi:hypothetical protein